jgi:hypothetical protein
MSDAAKRAGGGLMVVVALVVLGGTLRRGCGRAERLAMADAEVDQAISFRLGREVSADQEPGKVLLVRFSGFVASTEKLQHVQVKSFVKGLRGSGWDVVELPPPGVDASAHGNWVLRTSRGNWGNDLLDWAGPHPDAVALVSLVGVPRLAAKDWMKLPPCYARVNAAEAYERALLDQGEVAGLAVMREDSDPFAIRAFKGPLEELFDLAYEYLRGSPR